MLVVDESKEITNDMRLLTEKKSISFYFSLSPFCYQFKYMLVQVLAGSMGIQKKKKERKKTCLPRPPAHQGAANISTLQPRVLLSPPVPATPGPPRHLPAVPPSLVLLWHFLDSRAAFSRLALPLFWPRFTA